MIRKREWGSEEDKKKEKPKWRKNENKNKNWMINKNRKTEKKEYD